MMRPNRWAVIGIMLGAFVFVSSAFAGSGGFVIQGTNIELGEPAEIHIKNAEGVTQPQPPRFSSTVKKGQVFTLTAQGMTSSRGQAGEPYQPDSGAWTYDRAMFREMPPDKKRTDKTAISIRLKAKKTGVSEIHFTGKVLGYENKFDVRVEVVKR